MISSNKKYFSILLLLLSVVYSCEKDDICTEPTTPNLVMRLYDNLSQDDFKSANNLTVLSLPDLDTIYKNVSKDSLIIPLNVNENTCQYKMIVGSNTDVVQCNYDREDVFVSKTCGYKTIFHNLQVNIIADSDNWIKNKVIINSEITTDNLAHVKILH